MNEYAVYLMIFAIITTLLGIWIIVNRIKDYIWQKSATKAKYEKLTDDLKRSYFEKDRRLNNDYSKKERKLNDDYSAKIQKLNDDYSEKERKLNIDYSNRERKLKADMQLFQIIIDDKKQSCPTLAKVFGDFEYAISDAAADFLKYKPKSAMRASEIVREYGERNKILQQKNKELEYQIAFWKNLFPWLSDTTEVAIDDIPEGLLSAIEKAEKTKASLKAMYESSLTSTKGDYEKKMFEQKWQDSLTYKKWEDAKKSDKELLDNILSDKKQSCPELARVFADYEYIISETAASYLLNKSHPAQSASQTIRDYGSRNRALVKKCKELEYQLAFLENLFPWIEEFKEVDVDSVLVSSDCTPPDNEYETLKKWLSPQEYNSLTRVEKYQLALDRYRNRTNKTKWEIGVEYERYIGYKLECKGYNVEYRGALDGLQDMGRDLIASHANTKLVIQCKYWSSEKTIHEKHIFQLYGSVVLLRLQDDTSNIRGVFVTSTKLSIVAKNVAKLLDIEVYEEYPMSYNYPVIKCNINQSTGERIYHLPFDQQYDRCTINKSGEFYAMTVQDAESKGFRRAHRWDGYN